MCHGRHRVENRVGPFPTRTGSVGLERPGGTEQRSRADRPVSRGRRPAPLVLRCCGSREGRSPGGARCRDRARPRVGAGPPRKRCGAPRPGALQVHPDKLAVQVTQGPAAADLDHAGRDPVLPGSQKVPCGIVVVGRITELLLPPPVELAASGLDWTTSLLSSTNKLRRSTRPSSSKI